ncbi:MAG: peptide chain release factor 1 [Verrucomicrobium sp.]|nr:peptide chain release factor 1 [Verrucomicrobium sp.]
MDFRPHIASLRRRFEELESALSSPDLYADPAKARQITREHSRLKETLATCDRWEKCGKEREEAETMLQDAGGDAEMRQMAQEELDRLNAEAPGLDEAVQIALLPPDENEDRNTIIEIRAGTGGDEAALFAADLYRMYTRYAETRGWKQELHEISQGELGGLKEVIFQLSGPGAYKEMQFESGVHRVQRVPATEAQGRIHTSTATVAVLPEAEEVDVEIKPDDLRIEVCRSGGPGGQGVNTTDSAVQVLHIPTGMIVRCQDGRSQLKNREKALSVLRSRLLQQKQEAEAAKYSQNRKSQIGGGDRTEKIRTYNFPQNRITDHRINFSTFDLPNFLDGQIEVLLQELMSADLKAKLENLNAGTAAAAA